MGVCANPDGVWHNFPIPPSQDILHKGGFPRVVLKILAHAPIEIIESELPPNDFDVIIRGDQERTVEQAVAMGVDADGIEKVDDFSFPYLFKTRDIDLNATFIGKDGIVFSDGAYNAAQSGKINLEAYDRGFYGSEFFYYQGIRLAKNRGMMRLFKTVAEKKASSFDFLPLNKQVDLGIYWLVLARKFSKKENFGELMDRLCVIGQKTGQVKEGESIYEVLDRVHNEYPFFDIDSAPLDEIGLAQWKTKKLFKQIDRVFREKNHIPAGIYLDRQEGDITAFEISLKGYQSDSQESERIEKEWENFLVRCRRRTNIHVLGEILEEEESIA